MVTFENRDCMAAMKEFPDNFFSLAIVDPPYGDGGGYSRTDSAECSNLPSADEIQDLTERHPERSRFGGRFNKYKRAPEEWGINRVGYHGKQYKELVEHGRPSTPKKL